MRGRSWNLGLAALSIAWGLVAVLAGSIALGAGPLAFLRLALAVLTLAVVALVSRRRPLLRPGSHLYTLVVLGCVQATHWWLFFETVKRGSVALAVLTFYTAPLFLAVLAPLILPERLSKIALFALVPGGVGVALVALSGNDGSSFSWIALASGMGSALTFAVLLVLSKSLLHSGVAPLTITFWSCLVGSVVVIPLLPFAGEVLPDDASEWAAVLLLGVVFTALATLLYMWLLNHVTAQAAGVLTFLEPVSAIVLAWVLLGESLTTLALVGGVLVLCAGIVVVILEPTDVQVSEAVAGIGSVEA